MKGRIKKIQTGRGFGFIEVKGGKDIFFHCSDLGDVKLEDLQKGDLVNFEVEKAPKGPRAVNVERIDKDNAEK